MDGQNFDSLVRDYQMGQAYKHITDQMGPDAQLTAFINYDKITKDSLGLESFNLMDQHEQILQEIENGDILGLACESFESYLVQDMETSDAHDDEAMDEYGETISDGSQLDQLLEARHLIKSFGLHPSTLGLMKSSGLLQNCSLNAIALESMSSYTADSEETSLALESIMDTIKETAARWSAKLLGIVKKIGDLSFSGIANKIQTSLKAAAVKIGDGTASVGRTIKAHPYKSALVIVGTIAAAATVIGVVGQKLAAGESDAALKLLNDQLAKQAARNAQGGVNATIFDHVKPTFATVINNNRASATALWTHPSGATKMVTAAKDLGWTKSSIISLSSKITSLASQVSSAIVSFVRGATKYITNSKIGTEAVQIPGVSKKTSHRTITSLFWMVYRLVKSRIGGGFHHLAAILLRLMGH